MARPTCCLPRVVVLNKGAGGRGLGFTVVGGADCPRGAMGFYVKQIYEGGVAALDGSLGEGDELLAVNGESLATYTHAQGVAALKKLPKGLAKFVVRSRPCEKCRNQQRRGTSPLRRRRLVRESNRNSEEPATSSQAIASRDATTSPLSVGGDETDFTAEIVPEATPLMSPAPVKPPRRKYKNRDMVLSTDNVAPDMSSSTVTSPTDDTMDSLAAAVSMFEKNYLAENLRISADITRHNPPSSSKTGPQHSASSTSLARATAASNSRISQLSASRLAYRRSAAEGSFPTPPISPTVSRQHRSAASNASAQNNSLLRSGQLFSLTIRRQAYEKIGMGVRIDSSMDHRERVDTVIVHSLADGGAVARNGRVQPGMELVELQGTVLKGLQRAEVLQMLRELPLQIRLMCRNVGRRDTSDYHSNSSSDHEEKEQKLRESLQLHSRNAPAAAEGALVRAEYIPAPAEFADRASTRSANKRLAPLPGKTPRSSAPLSKTSSQSSMSPQSSTTPAAAISSRRSSARMSGTLLSSPLPTPRSNIRNTATRRSLATADREAMARDSSGKTSSNSDASVGSGKSSRVASPRAPSATTLAPVPAFQGTADIHLSVAASQLKAELAEELTIPTTKYQFLQASVKRDTSRRWIVTAGDGVLPLGYHVFSVDGRRTTDCQNLDTLWRGRTAQLTLQRLPNKDTKQNQPTTRSGTVSGTFRTRVQHPWTSKSVRLPERRGDVVVSVEKTEHGLGFSLTAAAAEEPLYVKRVFENSQAEGVVQAGDELLEAAGRQLKGVSRTDAWAWLKSRPLGPVKLRFRRPE